MSHIICNQVSLSYPVYDIDARSLKRGILNVATGGKFTKDSTGSFSVKALNNVSFHLKKGDRLGLIGHNGAGKSTLLKVLSGVYEPLDGYIHINGDISSLVNLNVGMQPTLSGYENIHMRGLILGLTKQEIKHITKDIEEFTELGNFLAMPVKTYSSGMLIRLGFALSTSLSPDILLVDEVIGAGDESFIEKAKNRMNEYINKSNIMVLSSHSNEIIKQFCNKVLWLEHGNTKAFGDVDVVLNSYQEKHELEIA